MKHSTTLLVLFISVFVAVTSSPVHAQTDIYIRGSGRLFPIAIPQLCLQQGETGVPREIPATISKDLDLSGYFQVLNPNSFVETPGKCPGPEGFAYSDWSVVGAEGLVRGVVVADGSRIKVQLYLHDVLRQNIVLGKEYEGDITHAPRIAHRFANEIMKFFTGEPGIFGSQIVFSSRVGRFKEMFVMDMDGSNVRQITNDRGLALSPSWNAAGDRLVYTSYRNRVPDLFRLDPASRRVEQITRGPALELGGKFARDGAHVLASSSVGAESDIVLLDLNGKIVRRITKPDGAIDVSPDFSPDESQIAFCSNRGGGPQIYTMNADGSGIRRISFVTSNYCTSPAWSPKGDRITYVCRAEGNFQLFVSNADGSAPLQLTTYGSNEDPAWSPDGNYIAFATTFGKGRVYHIALMRADGSNLRQLTNGRGGDMDPSWGPVLN